jgi:hypothetical protein
MSEPRPISYASAGIPQVKPPLATRRAMIIGWVFIAVSVISTAVPWIIIAAIALAGPSAFNETHAKVGDMGAVFVGMFYLTVLAIVALLASLIGFICALVGLIIMRGRRRYGIIALALNLVSLGVAAYAAVALLDAMH